jgi:hypothetical protein
MVPVEEVWAQAALVRRAVRVSRAMDLAAELKLGSCMHVLRQELVRLQGETQNTGSDTGPHPVVRKARGKGSFHVAVSAVTGGSRRFPEKLISIDEQTENSCDGPVKIIARKGP